MIRNPRHDRRRRIWNRLFAAAGLAIFVAIFILGRAGLYRIYRRHQQARQLQQDISKLKTNAALLKSTIEDFNDTNRIREIAKDKLGMTQGNVADSSKPAAGSPEAGSNPPAGAGGH